MADAHFRFIHASDFHLEQPVYGLANVPDHFRDLFIDAPYKSAERVFDVAVAEHVDFVILAGDIIDLRTSGASEFEFIRHQLERMNEQQIGVYWIGGRIDHPDDWPKSIPLPRSTNVFPRERVTEITHRRDDRPLARIVGTSGGKNRRIRGGEFRSESDSLVCIATAHGSTDTVSLRKPGIDYWALGGKHERKTLFNSPTMAHYCGSPQGRTALEHGPHGCTLAAVDESGRFRTRMVLTDVLRWHNEQLELNSGMSREDLARELQDRTRHLADTSLARQLLVSWSIVAEDQFSGSPSDALAAELRHGSLADELLAGLRSHFGQEVPGVWTVNVELMPPSELAEEWYEEDTVLGEMLRSVRQYQDDEDLALDLDAYLPERYATPETLAAINVADSATRRRLLQKAALLGVDLLRGQ